MVAGVCVSVRFGRWGVEDEGTGQGGVFFFFFFFFSSSLLSVRPAPVAPPLTAMSAFTRPPAAVAAWSARKLEPPPETKTASFGRGGGAPSAAASATPRPRRSARRGRGCARGCVCTGSAPRPAVEVGMVRCIAVMHAMRKQKQNRQPRPVIIFPFFFFFFSPSTVPLQKGGGARAYVVIASPRLNGLPSPPPHPGRRPGSLLLGRGGGKKRGRPGTPGQQRRRWGLARAGVGGPPGPLLECEPRVVVVAGVGRPCLRGIRPHGCIAKEMRGGGCGGGGGGLYNLIAKYLLLDNGNK